MVTQRDFAQYADQVSRELGLEPEPAAESAIHWDPPIPFDQAKPKPFPLWHLPKPLADFAQALAESTQTPPEMVGVLSLGVLAAAMQDKFTVEVTPDWSEPLCLYTVAVADPGERKSAVLAALTKPLEEYEDYRRQMEAVEVAQCRADRAMLEKQLSAAQNAAVKPGDKGAEARREALDLAAQLALFQDKEPFRLLVDDTTPEKLTDLLDRQGGCLAVCSAEGGLFDAMNGRYDKAAGFDVYLKAHAGDTIKVDRVGREGNHIKNPRLSMLLTVQPQVLQGLMSGSAFRGRGLCGRFLYAVCDSKVGRRDIDPAPVPEDVRRAYHEFMMDILTRPHRGVVRLDGDANEIRKYYQRQVETQLLDRWAAMRDWAGKLTGAMVRMAALLHAADCTGDPTQTPLDVGHLCAACDFAEVLASHAEAAYGQMGGDENTENAKYVLKRIRESGKGELTKREVFQLTKGKFHIVEELEEALQVLAEMNYLRLEEVKTGRRPSQICIMNPLER